MLALKRSDLVNYMRLHNTAKSREEVLVTDEYRFWYVSDVEDRLDVRDAITDEAVILRYCTVIIDRPEMRAKIKSKEIALQYCTDVRNRPEIRAIAGVGQDVKRFGGHSKKRMTMRQQLNLERRKAHSPKSTFYPQLHHDGWFVAIPS